ncbi:MAG: hypothetical protein HW390_1106 [Candidatus Brocadiaceae bacterium]|nr:hypothetical protein [Candidatus Brocadiaceae bacterium]
MIFAVGRKFEDNKMRTISILKKLLVLSKVAGYRYIMSTIIIFSLFILMPAVSYSSEQWAARYSGPGNGQDEAAAIAVDADGNVYVTGNSFGTNETRLDYATIKYDAYGNQQLAVDASGNVYVTGYSDGTGDYTYDYATVKYDANGNQQWVARYNGPGNGWDQAVAIAVDASGSVYVTGTSYGGTATGVDYATIKYDTDGNELWIARHNGPLGNGGDYAAALAVDASGHAYVTGSSYGGPVNRSDYATIMYDVNGNEQWVARYNGSTNRDDYAAAIDIDATGNVYVTGSSYRTWRNKSSAYATIKYDANGLRQWVSRYNGPGKDFDVPTAIAVDPSGNAYVTGNSKGDGTGSDLATIKYNADGLQQWVARYDGPASRRDEAYDLAVDASGNVYVTGHANVSVFISDYVTIKYRTNGSRQWIARYNGPVNGDDRAFGIALDASCNVYVTGHSNGFNDTWDYATIKYSEDIHVCADAP